MLWIPVLLFFVLLAIIANTNSTVALNKTVTALAAKAKTPVTPEVYAAFIAAWTREHK
jgi:hypothetical protein